MNDNFSPIPLTQLLENILSELQSKDSVLGLPKELFHQSQNPKFNQKIFGQTISTPIGVAAGPHSQMAQNIVAAWLMGARYIELKTIQTLDELDVAKPCIDIQDEGYNCEWSQELKINQSFNQYLDAWIIIHILNNILNNDKPLNTIFNMSVGYNLEGIKQDNVQWFFSKMNDCKQELNNKIEQIKDIYPKITNIDIPTQISDNITLSTMHGCPANEIEDIARYLMETKKLHTYVKLNPTLLGPDELRRILNKVNNFKTEVPDQAFEHDLKYNDALNIIKSLQNIAKNNNLEFGLKLTNTLESINNKDIFGKEIDMMYMSGRALHPLSVNLAKKLQNDFNGNLSLSFSGGADAFNVSNLIKCGFKTITVSSDLLKPGGYGRLSQYFEEINKTLASNNFNNISELASTDNNNKLKYLNKYADDVLEDEKYKRKGFITPSIKTNKELSYFDCIFAPCKDTCATHQDIPSYLYYTANKEYDNAYTTILQTNPFPKITGIICDHLCQNKCTRINYDESLLIREIKRFISEQDEVKLIKKESNNKKVAIIGAGPSGLSCAYYLALAGFKVDVFEKNSKAGGMIQFAIPGFRLTDEAINADFNKITELGVNINYNSPISKAEFEKLTSDYDGVYIAAGAQLSTPYNIPGVKAKGVIEPLDFLFNIKQNNKTEIGNNVVIIGGGNTAMDVARTAYRLVDNNGSVTIVYRRTIEQMPADNEEIKAVIEEGINIIELASPIEILNDNGKVSGIRCNRMKLSGKDKSGRNKPIAIENDLFELNCDTVIPSIGQITDIDFISNDKIDNQLNFTTKYSNVYVGGDAMRGAATAIKAIADGRLVAEKIINKSETQSEKSNTPKHNQSKDELMLKRYRREFAPKLKELELDKRKSFDQISFTIEEDLAIKEASRCLQCDEICNICTTVCPNMANYSYNVEPEKINLQKIIIEENNETKIFDDSIFEIKQKYQILNIGNYCNECGNCYTFCPTNSAPYKEKPKLFLTKESFDEALEGYFYVNNNSTETLYYKNNLASVEIVETLDSYKYSTKDFEITLNKTDFNVKDIKTKNNRNIIIKLNKAAEMKIILSGAKQYFNK